MMGNRVRDDYRQFRKMDQAAADSIRALLPELSGPAADATAQEWETTEIPWSIRAPSDLEVYASDTTDYLRNVFMNKYGMGASDATSHAQDATQHVLKSAGQIVPDDDIVARNVVRDLQSGAFYRELAEGEYKGKALAVTTDVPLEIPEMNISIPNMDQTFAHWRNVAAGRYTENLLAAAQFQTDMEGLGAAFDASWGLLQQGWFGYRIGETWQDILQRRLWPHAMITDDEGNQERKAIVPHMFLVGLNRFFAEVAKWSPRMLFSERYRDMQRAWVTSAREDIAGVLETEWYQNVLRGSTVQAYNLAGWGVDPLVDMVTPHMPNIRLELPPQGTPERERIDAQVKQSFYDFQQELGETYKGRVALGLLQGRALFAEFVEDPLFFAGEAAPAAMNVARKALAVSSRARVSGAIARHTGSLFDTERALADATDWLRSAANKYNSLSKQLSANPEKLQQARIQLAQARTNWVRLKAQAERFAEGTTEQVLVNNFPKTNPLMVARMGRTYLEANPEQAVDAVETMLRNLQRQADIRVDIVKRRLANQQPGDDPKFFQRQLHLSEQEAADVRSATEWFQSKAERTAGSRLSDVFKEAVVLEKPYAPDALDFADVDLDLARRNPEVVQLEISRNLRRGIEAGVPEEQLMQWELTLNLLNDGSITPAQAMRRVTDVSGEDILQMDIRSARLSALRNTPDTLVDLELIDEPVAAWNRMTAGPDAAESAGNAAMKLAAGAQLDDVQIRSMSPDTYFNATAQQPRARLGMGDEPNVWLGDEAFKTNVEAAEWQRNLYEKASDIFAKGLYPKAWNLRPIALLAHVREVGWALESINPRMMRRLENALNAQEWELHRLTDYFQTEFRAAGVLDEAGNVVEEAALMWGHRMNLAPESPEYIKMMQNLSSEEMRILRRLRAGYDFLADKQGLRNTDRRLVGYIAHAIEDTDFPAGTIDPVWQGVPADEQVFMPFLEWRNADPKDIDINIAMVTDRYIRGATKKIHLQPVIEELRQVGLQAAIVDPKLDWANAYVNNLIDVLQGRPSILGSMVQNMFANAGAARRAAQILDASYGQAGSRMAGVNEMVSAMNPGVVPVSSRVREKVHAAAYGASTLAYMGALGGNRRYFPMTVATGLATSGARFGMWRQVEGIIGLANPRLRDLAEKAGVRNHFSQLLDPHTSDTAKGIQRFSEKVSNWWLGSPSLQFAENTIRGWAFNAGLSELMTRTGFRNLDDVHRAGLLNSYIAEAAFTTQNLNHRFGMLGRPPGMRRMSESFTTMATQFLTFPYKQIETIAWLYRENPGYIARYMAYTGALTRLGNAAGVDLGQYVGVPGVNDLDTQSIMTESIGTLLMLAGETHRVLQMEGDPEAVNTLAKRAGEQLTNLIPVANAVESYWRSGSQLVSGEDRRPYGLVRNLDLGEFEWDEEAGVMENLSRIPLGFIDEEGGSTDMASILTGLRATEANVEKAQYDAAMQELKRAAFYRRRIADEFRYALQSGDDAEFQRLMQEAISQGIMPPDIERVGGDAVKSYALPRMMKLQAEQIDKVYEELERVRLYLRR